MGGNARFKGGTGGKVGSKQETLIFSVKSGAVVPVLPWKHRTLLTQITLPFI